MKLKWEPIDRSFDLQLINPQQLDIDLANDLLEKVKKASLPNKEFDNRAYSIFWQWLMKPDIQFLSEFAYATLSNWAFGTGNICIDRHGNRKQRAQAALNLWEYLFCANPDGRLTDPKIKGGKIILPERFKLWWPRQQKCQEDC
jgi:hypothetical protein